MTRGPQRIRADRSCPVTPFDVIKTRLQLQRPAAEPVSVSVPAPLTCCRDTAGARSELAACVYKSNSGFPVDRHAPRSGLYQALVAQHAQPPCPPHLLHNMKLASTCALADIRSLGALSHLRDEAEKVQEAVRSWVNVGKVPKPSAGEPPRLTGMMDGFFKVGQQEGVRGLWRGLTPTILMTVPSQVTYMVFYDFFKEQISHACRSLPGAKPSVPGLALSPEQLVTSLVAGASARSISATLVTPLELVRTRLQAVHGDSHGGMRANLHLLLREAKANPASLWRGLGPTLYRDVPFSAIYFTAYETFKRSLTGGSGLGERRQGEGAHSHSSEFAVAFVSGASAGILAALLTHPFDLVKTRRQAISSSHGDSTFDLLRQVYQREGVRGLFRGLSPRIAKVGPACGVMIGSFEVVGRLLDA